MALKFEITGDNRNLLSSLDGAREGVRKAAKDIEESGLSIEDMFKRIAAAAGIAFTLDQAKNFVKSVMDMRGQFQQLEIAFNTMLQSEEKATMLMSQLVDTAAKTPFDLQGVAQGAKQLLAYGIAADEVNETITRLGDIAAGLSIPLGDLVYLYGTTMTQGRMFTMDLRQFMGRGIPMAEELAKQFGVAKNEVAGLVTAGQVSSDAVKKAIWDMTSEGSRFGGLMAEQSKSITGQISNIEDAFDTMLNDIGKSNEGLINSGLEGVSFLIEHYKEVGRVLLGLVAAYGEYKAALMVTSAIQKSMAKQANEIEMARQAELQQVYDQFSTDKEVVAEETSTAAIVQNTASREGNVTAIDSQIAALERKMLAEIEEQNNVYQSAREALNVLKEQEAQKDSEINTLKEQIDTSKEFIESEKEAMQSALSLGNAEEAEAMKTNIATESKRLETLQEKLGTAQKEKNIIADQKHSAVITTKTALTQKQTMQEKLSNMQKAVSVVQTKAQTTATGLWVAVTKSATAAMNSLKAAMMSNPFGLALAAVTTLITLLPMFSSETSKASEEIERFGESAVKQTRNLETLMAVVDNTSKDSMVHKDAVDDLCKIYEEYGFKIDDEIDKLQQLKDMHDLVTDAIHREGEERQKANLLQSYNEALEEATTNMRDALQNAFESAEWDASGTFDDFDADEYQEKAKELTHIIGAIIQSESDALATLTGDELEAKISEVNDRIKKAYEDMGLQLSKSFVKSGGTQGAQGYTIDAPVDVDAIQIMRDYAEATHSVTEGRKKLIESFERGKKSAEEEKKEIDYTKLSIADLAKTASEASENISDLGDKSASPTVDKTSIDKANDAATTAKKGIDLLNGTTAKPLVDTSSIGFAIGQTNTLLGNMFQLQNFGMGGGKSSFSLGFNPNQFGFGKTGQFNLFGGKKPVWVTIGGKSGVQWMPDIPITDPAILAQRELNNRVNGANTQKKVDDLLKEVNDALSSAVFDSTEYKNLEALKKRLEAKSRKGSKSSKGNKADKIADEIEKLEDLQDNLAFERIRQAKDLETRVTDARLETMESGAEKVRRQQEQQNKEEIDSIERQREDAIRRYIEDEKKLFEQQEKIKKAKDAKYKEKKFDESKVDTSAIAEQYDELITLTKQKQAQDAYQESLRAMRDYMKEYGTLEQQRLAITQEYEEKIANAMSPTERASLMLERNKSLEEFDAKQFEEKIDWAGIFSELEGHTREYLIGLRDQLQGVLNVGNLTPEQMAVVQEKLRDINDEISKQNGLFQFQGDRAREHARLVQQAADAQSALTKAKEDEANAQQNVLDVTNQINHLLESVGIDRNIDADIDDKLLSQFDANSEEYKQMASLLEKLRVGEGNLAKARKDTTSATNKAKNAEDAKKRESAQAIADWFSDAQQFITEKGIDQIPDLLNELGLGEVGEKASKGLSAFNNAAGAAADFASGNYVGAALKGISAIKDVVSIFSGGSNAEEMLAIQQEMTDKIEANTYAIEKMTEALNKSYGSEAIKNAEELERRLKENYASIINGIDAALWSDYGGSHSDYYHINKNMQDALAYIEATYGSMYGIHAWDSPENKYTWNELFNGNATEQLAEMFKDIKLNNPDLWREITTMGYNEGALEDWLEKLISTSDQIVETNDSLKERLTTTTLDDVYDDYLNSLYELSDGSEEVFDNISDSWQKMVNRMVINNLVAKGTRERLNDWYEELAKISKDAADGVIDETTYKKRLEALQRDYQEGLKRDQEEIERLRSIGAIAATDANSEYKQEASSKGFQSMSQDTAEELNGRFTALQIAGENVATQVMSIYSQMVAMSSVNTSSNMFLQEIRNMMITTNSYLDDISKYSRKIYLDFAEKLDDVIANTKNL